MATIRDRRAPALLFLALLALSLAPAASARDRAPAPADDPAARLPQRDRDWLEEVAPLMSAEERQAFLGLGKDYQRQAFERAFWQARDPFPQTAINELRVAWQQRVELARARYSDLQDDRARMLLLNGPPESVLSSRCGALLRPLEIWRLSASPLLEQTFVLVFVQPQGVRQGRYRLWHPSEGLSSVFLGIAPGSDQKLAAEITDQCVRGDDVLESLTEASDWQQLEERGARYPSPGDEWLKTFLARSTDLPDAAALLPATLQIAFPARHQSRTVVDGVLRVPASAAVAGGDGDARAYRFVVDGEVLRKDELFESFRYRFDVPAQGAPAEIPLQVERFLRPGDYTLVMRVEDLNGGRYFRHEGPLTVPLVTAPTTIAATGAASAADAGATSTTATTPEAAASDVVVELSPPPPELLTGHLRVDADVRGSGVARVRFYLDGKPVLSKGSPPYAVDLDLGNEPRLHELAAVAEDERGAELARDEVPVNAGPHRFAVRLVEPRAAAIAPGQPVRAEAAVEVPAGEQLERVELFLDDTLLATLYQPPFAQTLVPPAGKTVSYVRAVAHLQSGAVAEDLAFLAAPREREAMNVDLVELYTSALDRRGRPVGDLQASDFSVVEDGKPQQLVRCEWVEDLPIHAARLLDTSTSMAEQLDQSVRAAQRFFDQLLTARDRAAVLTFADKPQLRVPFTHDPQVLAGGVAHLEADGETALYDSVVYSLWYMSGIRGKRVLVLLTDGDDTRSKHRYEEVLELARRSGVTIYAIGLGLPPSANVARMNLQRLAAETGGSTFFVDRQASLDPIYRTIERELRAQYLLAYQSTGTGTGYRKVKVEVKRSGVQANAAKGYYP